jgi:hypothetical protein
MIVNVEELAPRLVAGIYGTIVVAGVLAASGADEEPDVLAAGFYALATAVIFWVAHAEANVLGMKVAGPPGTAPTLRESLRRELPLVVSALPPLFALAIATLFGAGDETAIDAGLWLCVALLAACGAMVELRERSSAGRVARAAAGTGALGLLLVLLHASVH